MNWQAAQIWFGVVVCTSAVYFNIIGEFWVGLALGGVLGGMVIVQLLRLWWLIKQQIQAERELLVRMLPEIEQAIATIEQAQVAATRRRGLDTSTRAEMQRLQDEVAQAQQNTGS